MRDDDHRLFQAMQGPEDLLPLLLLQGQLPHLHLALASREAAFELYIMALVNLTENTTN